jgi:hypothetical protein
MDDAIAASHISHNKPMRKDIASRPLASAPIKREIDEILSYRINFSPITSKIRQCNRVKI